MPVTALTWNLFHGRDHPPDRSLHTWPSRLLRKTERNDTHLQVNRDLLSEFTQVLLSAPWDIALLQECPPRWAEPLAGAAGGDHHRVLTARNSLSPIRAALARLNPDLIASNEGGSNLILARGDFVGGIVERRDLVLRERRPERRTMAFARSSSGLCVANLHATVRRPDLAAEEVLSGAAAACEWAGPSPLLFGGDFNLRPAAAPAVFTELRERHGFSAPHSDRSIDHLLARNIEPVGLPEAWPARRREVREDGRALRLSDHAPVQGDFTLPE